MKNKPLSPYKKLKLIEAYCDELTATQAAHRLNLDRNTINKYYKRIREHIAAYREYYKMRLLIAAMSKPGQQVEIVSRQIPSMSQPNGIGVRLMCINGQLLTEPDLAPPVGIPVYNLSLPQIDAVTDIDPQAPQPYDHYHLEQVVDEFHSFACSRFKKYFGIKGSYAYLYIKEAEFVFNERDGGARCRLLKGMRI